MTPNTILIVTHSNDNLAIDKVTTALIHKGYKVVRLNTDLYPYQVRLEVLYSSSCPGHQLITETGEILLDIDIYAVWYRRFNPGADLPKDMDKQQRKACREEAKRTLLGYLQSLDCFVMDDYWQIRKASNKEYQQKLALQLGLNMPATLITNQPAAVMKFHQAYSGKMITKMQTAFSLVQDNREQVVYTSKVEEQHLQQLDGLALCPMVFQENIHKQLELRVTLVGDRVFCAALDSNKHAEMRDDWRKIGAITMHEWFDYSLPEDITYKLQALRKKLSLNYGAADIILTPEDQYYFLEINPCGEFYWLDQYTQAGICEAIAEHLHHQGVKEN
ncbi:MvdC/MvdD family ATP grasp protein [Microbulbifer spongiae]|uniref:MvdD-like pre-ATP grasp domain-containing protein n=1 Tax=Microbulbifer spongiae TaxID=2944933 RepID=A0ABY9EBB9_9GAMM|nr:hypothetical protein [Microbulbifer sp. MI-G]WKD50303.1 hypothetical protein M8T91_02405 [Microbulbifer sp. MI-G]